MTINTTPTEQDKELLSKLDRLIIENQSDDGSIDISDQRAMRDEIMQLITADRRRVALEARIDEISHIFRIVDGRIFWQSDISLAMPIDERIAQLKAQQEEV